MLVMGYLQEQEQPSRDYTVWCSAHLSDEVLSEGVLLTWSWPYQGS